jgi:hypothetical protein
MGVILTGEALNVRTAGKHIEHQTNSNKKLFFG